MPGHAEVHAICVHLSLLESHRQLQLQLLCQLLESLPEDAPVIIAGDFNDWQLQGNATLARRDYLHEAFERHHGRPAKTYPARFPLLRLTASTCATRVAMIRRSSATSRGRTCPITCRWRLKCTCNHDAAHDRSSVGPAEGQTSSTPSEAEGSATSER